MIHKPRTSTLFVIIIFALMFILSLSSSLMDKPKLNDLFIVLYAPVTIIIMLCDEIGYFNRKIVSTALIILILAWCLILYSDYTSTVDKIQYYGINGLLAIFIILAVLWMFRNWNKIEKAVEPYNKILGINPDDTISLNNKGVELTHMKKYNWAMDYFDKVLELDPDDSAALHNKGVVITKLKKTRKATEKANEYFDRALKSDPGFENAKHSGKMILET